MIVVYFLHFPKSFENGENREKIIEIQSDPQRNTQFLFQMILNLNDSYMLFKVSRCWNGFVSYVIRGRNHVLLYIKENELFDIFLDCQNNSKLFFFYIFRIFDFSDFRNSIIFFLTFQMILETLKT